MHFFLHNKKTRIAHLGCGLTWAVNWTCLALSPRAHGSAQAQRPRPQPSGRPSQPSRARMDRPISTAHSPAAGAYPSPTRVHGPAQLACAWAGPAHPVHSPVAAACPHVVVVTRWCCWVGPRWLGPRWRGTPCGRGTWSAMWRWTTAAWDRGGGAHIATWTWMPRCHGTTILGPYTGPRGTCGTHGQSMGLFCDNDVIIVIIVWRPFAFVIVSTRSEAQGFNCDEQAYYFLTICCFSSLFFSSLAPSLMICDEATKFVIETYSLMTKVQNITKKSS